MEYIEGVDYTEHGDGHLYLNRSCSETLTREEVARFLVEEGNWTVEELKPWPDLHIEAVWQSLPPLDSVNRKA